MIDFLNRANVDQVIDDAIFFAPRSEVLMWEKYFADVGHRCNVMYYDESSLREGVLKNWARCRINKHNSHLPRTKEVEIFEAHRGTALRTH